MRKWLVVLALLIAAGSAGAEGELSRGARDLLESASRMAKSAKLNESQSRILRKATEGLSTEEFSLVVDRVAELEDLPSSEAVLAILEGELYPRLFGREPLALIEGFGHKLRSTDPADAEGLLAAALALEDFRLAFHLAAKAAASKSAVLRARTAIAFGDLLSWGYEPVAAGEALSKLLDDPSPAVRGVACRRAFEAEVAAVVPFALGHLEDRESESFMVRGQAETIIPGAEALKGLLALTRVEDDMTWEEFRRLSAERRRELSMLWAAWWEEKGAKFPPPGSREASFRAAPSEVRSVILSKDETTASVQFWAGADRTKIRLSIDEFTWAAASLYDFTVSYHLRYMAQGQRTDDGEDWVRRHPAGVPRVLARKAIGCYVLVFQYLLGERIRLFVRFHDV
jgi:hypothetical protein